MSEPTSILALPVMSSTITISVKYQSQVRDSDPSGATAA
jgi:hypothetical protein